MNHKIKELRTEAMEYANGVKMSDLYTDWYEAFEEKFAKLIIEECYQHCKDQLMDKSLAEEAGLDYNDGVMDCAIGLKQHFGVESNERTN